MGWQDAPVVGEGSAAPSGNPVAATPSAPQAAQADVRKVDQQIMPSGKRRSIPGDAGAALGAGEALDAFNRFMDRTAYAAGGKVTDAATAIGLPPQAAAGAGYATNVGIQSVPMVLGGEGAARAAPAMQNLGRKVMQSALKPNKAARESGDAAKAIDTLLEKGVNVTKGGVEKLTAEIDKLDDAVTKSIQGSKADVSTLSVLQPVKDAIAKFKYGLDNAANEKAIRGEMLKFFDHPQVQQALQIPVETAQKIKRAIYTELGDKAYGIGLKSGAEAEGKKAVARGLKEGIERAVPGTKEANAQMGAAINARDLVQDRVLVAGNKNPIGLGWLNPSEMIPWLADRSELVKSLIARGLYSGAERIPQTAGQAVGATAGAVSGRPPQQRAP